MSHNHSHYKLTAPKASEIGSAFAWSIGLNTLCIIVGIGPGVILCSVALITDAIHNLSDMMGLLISWGAMKIGKRIHKVAYGYQSATILLVLISTVSLCRCGWYRMGGN